VAPDVTPQNGANGVTKAAWIYDGIGLTNVTAALGIITGDSILIVLNHSNTIEPDWLYATIATGDTYTAGGDAVPGYPSVVQFAAIDMAQKGTYAHQNGITESWSATPIH
jgi:hypothetical protein